MVSKEVLQWRMERALAAVRELDIDLWISIGRETHLLTDPALTYLLPSSAGLTALVIAKTGESICLVSPMHIEEM